MSVTGPRWFNRKRVKDRTSPPAAKSKRPRRSGIMALEPRMMYDAAAAATVGAAHHHHHGEGAGDHTAIAAAEQGAHSHGGNTGRWDSSASTSSVWSNHAPQSSNVQMPPPPDSGEVRTTSPRDAGGRDNRAAGGAAATVPASAGATVRELVVIDSNVADIDTLLAGVKPGDAVLVLDPTRDGVQQIADSIAANGFHDLTAIQIVSHGTPGAVDLGSISLSDDNLDSHAAALAAIGAALKPGGDILLYGCDVAAGAAGAQFIADLSAHTGGANVAASTDATGSAALGGNWTLEAKTGGAIDATVPFSDAALVAYPDLLVDPIDNQQASLALTQLVVPTGTLPSRDGTGSGFPVGAIRTFAGNFPIGNTFLAEGQTEGVSQNISLFSVLGKTYGGNGVTTFALPDLGGKVMIGQGSASNGTDGSIGSQDGSTLVSLAVSNLPGEGDQPVDNDQPSLTITYGILAEGVFPDGNSSSDSTQLIGEIVAFAGNFSPGAYLACNGQVLAIAQYQSLFDVIGNTYGGSADAGTFALPDLTGRAIIGASSTTPLGTEVGSDATTITSANMPTAMSGGGTPVDNREPSLALNYIISTNGLFPTGSGALDGTQAYLGEVMAFAGDTSHIPQGWVLADGRILSLNQNQALFSVLGNTYGGNGQTTFALPDLRDHVVIGTDPAANLQVGANVGSNTITLTPSTTPDRPPTISVPANTTTVLEQHGAVPITTAAATVNDLDLDGLNGGTGLYNGTSLVVQRQGTADASDSFGFSTAGASFTVNGSNLQLSGSTFAGFTDTGGTLTITFTSSGLSRATVDDVLRHITYDNTSDGPPQNLSVTFIDGTNSSHGADGPKSVAALVALAVTPVNDPPVPTASVVSLNPDTTYVFKASDFSFTDPDSPPNALLNVIVFQPLPLPSQGTLNFNGTPLTDADIPGAGRVFSIADINAGKLTFTPAPGKSGTDLADIMFGLQDNGGTANGGKDTSTSSADLQINVIRINHPPVLTNATASLAATEQVPALLEGGIVVADKDLDALNNGSGDYAGAKVTVSRVGGASAEDVFDFDATGASFTVSGSNLRNGQQNFAGFISFNGTLTINFISPSSPTTTAMVNEALQHIRYTDTSNTPTPSFNVEMDFYDGNSGAQGTGGEAKATVVTAVTVTPVNDAPVNHVPGALTVNEDTAFAFTGASTISISDPDASGDETVTLGVLDGTLTLGTTAGLTSFTNNAASITLTGSVTNLNTALASLSYLGNRDFNGSDTLSITTNDNATNGALQTTSTVALTVNPVNDPPSFTLASATTSSNEDAGPQSVANFVTAISPGPADESSQTVSFIVSGDSNPGMFAAGPAIDASGNLTYTTAANANGTATITVHAKDSGGTTNGGIDSSADQTFTITINAVNDAPALSVAANASYIANGSPTALDPGLTVSDVDGGPGYSATVAITGGFVAGDQLIGGGTWDASTHTFTTAGHLAPNATLAALQADLRTLAFSSSSTDPGPRTLTWTISDGSAQNSSFTTTSTVTRVNAAPVLSDPGNPVGYSEQAAATALSSTIAVSDVDSPDLAGATVTIASGLEPGDVLHFTGQNGISGIYGNGVLTLSGEATPAQYQAALRSITFDNLTNDDPTNGGTSPNRIIQWQVNDGSSLGNDLSDVDTGKIIVTPVDDAPVNTVPGQVFAGENTVTAISGLSVHDADAGSANIGVKLTVSHGTLTVLTNVPGGLGGGEVAGNGTDIVLLAGSQAAIDATLAANLGLLYAPDPNYTGPDTLTVHTSDLGHTGTGAALTADSTVAISVGNLAVVQTTVLTTDVDGDGIADPGDTVTTTVNIANVSGTAANNVSFTENPLDGMTLVPGTVNVSPIAINDSYALSGNTPITISAANGVLANDIEFLGASFGTGAGQTHVENVSVGPGHGNLVLNADGSFTYTPVTGFTGTDSFTYQEIDAGGLESAAQVTLTVGPSVWYVDSSASATGADGSFAHPFTSLAAFATSRPDSAGDTIFVYNRGTAYAGTGITLLDNESLIGDGAPSFQVNGHTLGGNTNVALSDSGSTLLKLGSGDTVRGFDLGNASTDISGTNFGTLTLDHVSINSNGQALNLTTGTFAATDKFTSITSSGGGLSNISMTGVAGTVDLGNGTLGGGSAFFLANGSVSTSYHGDLKGAVIIGGETGGLVVFDTGSITSNGGISVIGDTGGVVTFQETSITLTTQSGTGIDLSNNTGAIINFFDVPSGSGLHITTTTGTGFEAIGGGTIGVDDNFNFTITGVGNSIVTTTGTALDVENTTIGPGGLNFHRITAGTANSGPTNAIILSNTGSTAGLTVSGDENENEFSGGIIQHTGGDAILLKNTQDVTLNAMTIENTGGSGINGTGVTNFTADKNTFSNNGNAGTESAIAFDGNVTGGTLGAGDNIDGTLTLTRNTFTSSFYAALDVQGDDGTITSANLSNNTITTPKTYGFNFVGAGTATTVFSIDGASIANNQFTSIAANALNGSGAAIQISVGNNSVNGPNAHAGLVTIDSLGRPASVASDIISISGNSGSIGLFAGEFISISSMGGNSGAPALVNFAIKNNGTTANPVEGGAGPIIQIVNDGFADMAGVIDGNVVEFGSSSGIAASNGPGTQGNTVYTPKLSLAVTNNTALAPTAILLTNASGTSGGGATGGDGTAWFKVAGNTVGGSSTSGIRVNAGNASSTDDAVFLDIFGNTSSVGGTAGIGLFKQGNIATLNDFALYDAVGAPDLAAAPTNAQVVTFVNALNPGMAGGTTIVGGSNFERDTVQGLPLVAAPGGVAAAPVDGTTAPADSGSTAAPQDPAAPTTDAGTPHQTPPVTNVDNGVLIQDNLETTVQAAIERWADTGLSAAQIAYLESVTFSIADMAGGTLGAATPGAVTIDVNAAGNGWYIDPTPMSDAEFSTNAGGALFTTPDQAAAGHVDLLTTVMHELGHELGLSDTYAASAAASLMYGTIVDGERRLPVAGETDGAVLGSIVGQEFSVGPMVSIGTLPAGKSVTVTFQATIDPQSDQLAHNPANQGTVTSSFGTVTTNTVVTPVDTLTVGNQVFFDANADGTFDAGDTGVDNVALTLFADTDHSGGLSAGDTQIATTVTANGGLYSFGGLAPGDYIVRVDAGNFAVGGSLAGLAPASGGTDPDNNIDNDSNGIKLPGSIAALPITLAYNTEPTSGSGHDSNNTLDFGFVTAPSGGPLTAQGGLAVSGVEGAALSATVATFTDADPNGSLADFTATIAWGDGSSSAGTVSVDNGVYSVAGTHTYAEEGAYTATATINVVGGAAATASSTATVADAPLTAQNGLAVSGVEGAPLVADVATFTDANPNAAPGDFTATIDWGDGSTSAGAIIQNGGVFSVAGNHAYAEAGTYTATADIKDIGGSTAMAGITAVVADAPLTAQNGLAVSGVEGAPLVATVATFTDANPNAAPGDFTATIDWGDGSTSSGVVIQNGGVFAVVGNHAYAEAGTYMATADIKDIGGSTATAGITTVVADAALTAQDGVDVSGVQGTALTTNVATFTDANPDALLGDFTATITWGDGSTSSGTIVAQNGGGFAVTGTHAYALEGTFTATADISDVGGSTATAGSTVVVADAPLTAQDGLAVSGVEGAALIADVATFTDADPNGTVSDYTATVDWGDGSTSSGTVVAQNGGFAVIGTHSYAEAGSYTATATIDDVGGSTATAGSTARIADAPLSGSGAHPISAVEGLSVNSTVTFFTDANPLSTAADFAATINWGDGTSSAGVVSLDTGIYSVKGTHTYAEAGSFNAVTAVRDAGGATTSGTTLILVVDEPLTPGVVAPISGTEGAPVAATVAAFTDANKLSQAGDFTATIDWGDGTTSAGTVTGSGGSYSVDGTHTYAAAGSHVESTAIKDVGGSTMLVTDSVSIADAPLTASGGLTVNGVEGASFTATLASFTDANPNATVTDYTAKIAWGDGSTSDGTVVAQAGGGFVVIGTHAYAEEGTYTATADITDVGGATAEANSTAVVADAPLTAQGGLSLNGVEGAAFTVTVATFTDADPNGTVSDYTATINWGDGTASSAGTVIVNNGVYSVIGTHTYLEEGSYTATASIADVGGATAVASSTATVADAPLTVLQSVIASGDEGVTPTDVVVTFADADSNSQLGDFTATIAWGDGTTSAGSLSVNNGVYAVEGAHTYAEEGSYTATTTIADVGGATAAASGTVVVRDAPLTAQGSAILNGVEGSAITANVATFTDANPNGALADFTATIDWGDGTSSGGVIAQNGGGFAVTGSHAYAGSGVYTAVVAIADEGGSTAKVTDTVDVLPTAPEITTLVGTPLNGQTVELRGSGDAGDTVNLYADGNTTTVVGTGTVGVDGTFDITTTTAFADRAHTFTATQTDATHLLSAVSSPAFTANVLPNAPDITAVVGQPVNGGRVELQGTGEVGETVNLFADGNAMTVVGTGAVGADGRFDITTTAAFDAGAHTFTATETDAARLTGPASAAFTVNVTNPQHLFTDNGSNATALPNVTLVSLLTGNGPGGSSDSTGIGFGAGLFGNGGDGTGGNGFGAGSFGNGGSGTGFHVVHTDAVLTTASDATVQINLALAALEAPLGGDIAYVVARQANGDPLPGWLKFDPATGQFAGLPPDNAVASIAPDQSSDSDIVTGALPPNPDLGIAGPDAASTPHIVTVEVLARDSRGNVAVTLFTINLQTHAAGRQGWNIDRPAPSFGARHASLPTTSPELAAIEAAVRGATVGPFALREMPVRHGDAIAVSSAETAPAGRAGLTEQLASIGWRGVAAQRNALLASLQGR